MKKSLQKKYEAELARHADICLALAEERIDSFATEWARTRSGDVELLFGMGTMYAKGISDKYSGSGWPKILQDLEDDVQDLTNNFRTTCPEDRLLVGRKNK
jgi:type II secretory pathway pseudopilin PulG